MSFHQRCSCVAHDFLLLLMFSHRHRVQVFSQRFIHGIESQHSINFFCCVHRLSSHFSFIVAFCGSRLLLPVERLFFFSRSLSISMIPSWRPVVVVLTCFVHANFSQRRSKAKHHTRTNVLAKQNKRRRSLGQAFPKDHCQ